MCLSEDLYSTMVEVGNCARRHKIPGPLADAMISAAQNSIDLWRSDEKDVMIFAFVCGAYFGHIRGIVKLTGFLNQQQVDAWFVFGLLADVVDNDMLFLAKNVDG